MYQFNIAWDWCAIATRRPKYHLHKAKNLAAVAIDGRHIYLGSYITPPVAGMLLLITGMRTGEVTNMRGF